MSDIDPSAPHPFRPIAIDAVIERERQLMQMEMNIAAILSHVEKIDAHLLTLNSKTLSNSSDIADVRSALMQHLHDIELRRELPRLDEVEKAWQDHQQQHKLEMSQHAAANQARADMLTMADKFSIRVGPIIMALIGVYEAISKFG